MSLKYFVSDPTCWIGGKWRGEMWERESILPSISWTGNMVWLDFLIQKVSDQPTHESVNFIKISVKLYIIEKIFNGLNILVVSQDLFLRTLLSLSQTQSSLKPQMFDILMINKTSFCWGAGYRIIVYYFYIW